ncbi:bifunctional alpha/beta hydrolase/OsmC family protein [Rufibacter tibetensis]|uniref:Osmotically inducible protein C n=1 Tax=Rufibacter tibetensis TaxID=512763 RepID=A0A0P0CGD6_9BACT|nr:bifunctional alpha/beta hydrolase/OsmC family protein [Rufibacter tibetensis]ALJ00998.1 osmotically inducible protein C [Rufibacter tibetensis]
MKSIPVTFPNSKGQMLAGRVEMPVDGRPHSIALFAHCFTCSKNLTAIRNISRALSLQGIAVLRFDFTGLGQSDGNFEQAGFSSDVSDLVSAAHFLEQHYKAPVLAIGHSLGGAAVLMAANSLPTVKALVTIGAPCHPAHVRHLLHDDLETIEREGVAMVNIGGRPFPIKKEFLDDLSEFNPKLAINTLGKALLVLHAPQDVVVSIDNAADIYQAARHPKSFISLDGADHLLSNPEDSFYTGEVIGSWVKRYLQLPEAEPINARKRVAVRIGPDALTTEVMAGGHSFMADEPESVGGLNLGPTPYDLLTAGLGACTAMTLRLYADRKKWPLQNVLVHLHHEKVHEVDSESPEKKSFLDHIWREIELEGNLTKEQRQRLLEIAERCPVHKTLHKPVKISTTLLPDPKNSGTPD